MLITVANSIPENTTGLDDYVDNIFKGATAELPESNERNYLITKTFEIEAPTTVTNPKLISSLESTKNWLNNYKVHHQHPEREYTTFQIPKKTHGYRTIDAPNADLSRDLRFVSNLLKYELRMLPHNAAWAYTHGRSVVSAMQQHTDNESKWYLKLDLHNFFGSCNPDFIYKQLKQLYPIGIDGYEKIITDIISLGTKDGGLPQGTPLSPILTNLIMIPIDYKITKALRQLDSTQRYVYTRYADDIIISAKYKFDYTKVVAAIADVLKDTPLQLNEEKTRFGSSSGRNWNLGVMCNKDNKTTVGYKRKQKLKAAIHNYLNTNSGWNKGDVEWLQGQLSWLHAVEPEYHKAFIQYINKKYRVDLIKLIKIDLKTKSY